MRVLFTLSLLLLTVPVFSQIRLTSVDPVNKEIIIRNFGTTEIDISDYRLCSSLVYTTNLTTNVTVITGDLVLSADEEVTLNWNPASGFDVDGRDMGLYLPGVGGFGSAANMVDYMQYLGSYPAPEGRENVAGAAGIWTAGTFVSGAAPYVYTGNGTDIGADFWTGMQLNCAITNLSAGTQTACDPANNTYTQEVIITYENAPSTGTLDVNGQTFIITNSPQTVILSALVADGNDVDVTASFTDESTCSLSSTALFTSPVNCTPQPCAITNLNVGTQTACDPVSNTYTQEVIVTFENAPTTGNLEVNGQTFAIGSSPQTVTLTALTADGNDVDVTASFTDEGTCSLSSTALFTSPINCTPQPCAITNLSAGTQTACDPSTNTYTQEVTVTFENAPSTGNLEVNGQTFAIGSSPQTVTLTALTADGNDVDVTASFTDEGTCSLSSTALFTSPVNCTPQPCAITDLSAGTQTACDPSTNTYTQEVIVTFENAPSTGNLEVNGQTFAIGTSPQTITLTALTADGNAVDVTASFTDEGTCSLNTTTLFTAPVDCSPINEVPLAEDDQATTLINQPILIEVLNNDQDPDGTLDDNTVMVVQNPQNGQVIVDANGAITYTPNMDYVGEDEFTYTVDDDEGATSNEATVMVSIDAVTNLPCSAPQNLYVRSIRSNGVGLTWDQVPEAKYYIVELTNESGETKTLELSHNKVELKGLDAGISYRWRVYSFCEEDVLSEAAIGMPFTTPSHGAGIDLKLSGGSLLIKVDRNQVRKLKMAVFDDRGQVLKRFEAKTNIETQYEFDIPRQLKGQLLIIKVKTNIGRVQKKIRFSK